MKIYKYGNIHIYMQKNINVKMYVNKVNIYIQSSYLVEHYYSYTSHNGKTCHRLFSQKYTYPIKTSVQNTINIKNRKGNNKNEMEMSRISWKTQK